MSQFRKSLLDVAYVFSSDSTKYFDKLPSNRGRSTLVHSLIESLNLTNYMHTFSPNQSGRNFLEEYHTSDYLDLILREDDDGNTLDHLESYGLVDDCSIFEGLQYYARYLGGSVQASLKALDEGFRYVINWDGGRHHAQASLASGFCFINDAVLLILNLATDYDKILYIDLDLHHGDGVESAFAFSDKVFTLSMHKYAAGFFPGTGKREDCGKGKGTGFCLNVPISHKISGKGFYDVFEYTFKQIIESYDPDIIVCVCGADVLSTDPHAAFDVGSISYSNCIYDIVKTQIPTVFLGGGGYNHTSTAKLWAILTHKIISRNCAVPSLPQNVPEHEFWPFYAHDDDLLVLESKQYSDQEMTQINEIKSYVDERICY